MVCWRYLAAAAHVPFSSTYTDIDIGWRNLTKCWMLEKIIRCFLSHHCVLIKTRRQRWVEFVISLKDNFSKGPSACPLRQKPTFRNPNLHMDSPYMHSLLNSVVSQVKRTYLFYLFIFLFFILLT